VVGPKDRPSLRSKELGWGGAVHVDLARRQPCTQRGGKMSEKPGATGRSQEGKRDKTEVPGTSGEGNLGAKDKQWETYQRSRKGGKQGYAGLLPLGEKWNVATNNADKNSVPATQGVKKKEWEKKSNAPRRVLPLREEGLRWARHRRQKETAGGGRKK